MKKFRTEKQRLIWMVDFANQNIDELSEGDLLKALFELKENIESLYSQIAYFEGGKKDPLLFAGDAPYSLLEDTSKVRKNLKSIQGRLKDVFETICYAGEAKDGDKIPRSIINGKSAFKVIIRPGELFAGRIATSWDLIYEIVKLLYDCSPPTERDSGIPFHSSSNLKRCQIPECNKFFWQAHRKEKNYCSNQCAWVAYSRAKRGKGIKNKKGE